MTPSNGLFGCRNQLRDELPIFWQTLFANFLRSYGPSAQTGCKSLIAAHSGADTREQCDGECQSRHGASG